MQSKVQESEDGVVKLLGMEVVEAMEVELLGMEVGLSGMEVVVILKVQHSTEEGESQNPASVLKTDPGGQ